MTQDGNEYPPWTRDFPKPKEGEPRRRSGFPSAPNSESFRLSTNQVHSIATQSYHEGTSP
ncbi:hypothetical protein WN51_12786 [Melipona quadrifasciata]|uniref:Uncharacterized protein n=1 Tax=Melipona quadrifasciata TaxID=166423 RepID=A0A0M9A220_9HYME|nr:hypothetical protein WN51_12786 [Melipona quadrifasciata]